MTKQIIIILSIFTFTLGTIPQEQENSISGSIEPYQDILDELNYKYGAELYILSFKEFNKLEMKEIYGSYNEYIGIITSSSLDDFYKSSLSMINIEDTYNYKIEKNLRATLGDKTVYFNAARNSMTLKYKYDGKKFDVNYKPVATVKKIDYISFFDMTSYTGAFANKNSTYSVTAKGKVYSSMGVVQNKTFTVNFNL